MAFSDTLTKDVKRRAHFQCCLCKSIGVEIHHIVPSSENGPDTSENAAPLCPSCHETYGANPTKRKLIRQARDLWYEICEKRYAPDSSVLTEIRNVVNATASKDDLTNLRQDIVETLRSFAPPAGGVTFSVPRKTNEGSPKYLSISDFIVMLYGHSSERDESQVGVLTMREFWPIKNGVRSIYNEFLANFGLVSLKSLASRTLDENRVPKSIGLTEHDIEEALRTMHVEAVCMNELAKGEFRAVLRDDGEVAWYSAQSQEGAL